ncbi:MAG: collagen-binding domain-containing protein [Bacteroidota bacterium]
MRKLLLLCTAFILSGTSHAQSPTAAAKGFNVFLENGAKLINNETEGPVAMGGDLRIAGGYQVSTNYPGTFYVGGVRVTLVVGGRVYYESGSLQVNQSGYAKIGIPAGSTCWYTDMSGAYSPMRITPGSDYNGYPRLHLNVSSNTLGVSASVNPVFQAGVINFSEAFTTLRAKSACIGAMADNAVITNSAGTPIPHTGLPSQVKINLNTGINVLNVSGADFNHITDFIYNTTPDASHVFIVNVNAAGAHTWSVPNSGGIGLTQCKYIMFNFYNATTLTIGGYGAVQGTIFAPNADIIKTSNMSNVEGQIIAKSYIHGGGENHYAVFEPSVSSCATIPTAASFTVNNAVQCNTGHSFVFTNGSTGSGTLSYLWKFGDGTTATATSPAKTYTATGTYTVKLITTGAAGADSVTRLVTVSPNPVVGFSINLENQYLTGNNYLFTTTSPDASYSYSWDFGDGSLATGIANPVKTYSAIGTYAIIQTVSVSGGCSATSHAYAHVLCDTVSSGGDGGLESESLGDLVSRRMYNRIKNSINPKPDYASMPVFNKQAALMAAAKGTASSSLQRFMPASLDAAMSQKISTPADITTITRAVDVFSVDYTKTNSTKAVVLGITTLTTPYNHTKSICDRFRGATLVSTEKVAVNGYNFILFGLKQDNGTLEYSITFAAGKSAAASKFRLQGSWLISEYAGDDSVFNFQVWAASPDHTIKLTKDVLANLAAVMPLEQADANFALPPAYITAGKRNKGFLDITIRNNTPYSNAKIIFEESKNETSGASPLHIPFYLMPGDSNVFHLPIYDGYEYEGHLYLNDTLADNVYMADGNWSLDYDHNYTTVNNYKPDNNYARVYHDNEYPLYRSVTVSARSNDYVNIYKFIASGEEKVNLSDYKSYKFFAKGSGKVEIRLIKEGIVKWADQYKTTITLDSVATGKQYALSLEDFTSDNIVGPIKATDITAVVYAFTFDGKETDLNFFADEQAFSKDAIPATTILTSKSVSIFPNPAVGGAFQCIFASDAARQLDMVITDIKGNVAYTQPITAAQGYNTVSVSLPAGIPAGMYMVKIGNKDVTYSITKLSIVH